MSKVAVYGSLRKGMGNHSLLSKSQFLGQCVVEIPYAMHSIGAFPALLISSKNHPVVIEVYSVDDSTLTRLNHLEGYRGENANNFYDRVEIDTPHGKAYIYVLTAYDRSDTDKIHSGDWVRYLQLKNSSTVTGRLAYGTDARRGPCNNHGEE